MNLARRRFLATSAALSVCSAISDSARAGSDNYPTKPIHLIVPYPPAGVVDLRAREIAERLPKYLGQPIVIENRGGAGGVLGTSFVVKSAPDGYTLLIGASSQIVFEPLLNPNVSYDPERDLIPVSMVVRLPFLLAINPDLNVHSVKDFIALARVKPGAYSIGSGGSGTSTYTLGELFQRAAGIELTRVPYKGDAQATTDLVGGHIQAFFVTYPVVREFLRAGKLRALMQTGAKRIAAAPDVPTAAEAGFPDLTVNGWMGIFAPARTSPAIVSRLNAAIVRCLEEADLKRTFEESGSEPIASSPEEFAEFARTERRKWKMRLEATGVRLD